MATDTAVSEQELTLFAVILRAWPLLLSILFLMTGSGLQGVLLGVRAEQAAFEPMVTGLVLGLYYLGYVAGSMWVPGLIRSVGHIRVFSALASLASAAVVIHGVWVSPLPWVALRFLTGVCVAGLFVVSESWLNEVADTRTRGTLLAVYNTLVTLGLTIGSLLLNAASPTGMVLFVIGSVLLSVAAVPVALAPHRAPSPEWYEAISIRAVYVSAPLGILGSSMSGLATGAGLGFGAVYATRAGFGVGGASQFIAAILIGAVVGQIPLGRWSDHHDRRLVMGVAGVLIAGGAAAGLVATSMSSFTGVLFAGLLLGAGGFSLYGLSFAHMADYIEPANMVSAGARLITVSGLGAAAGPFLASVFIGIIGPQGFFHLLGGVSSVFIVYVLFRLFKRPAVPESERSHYTPVNAGTTTYAALDSTVSEVVGIEADELRRRRRRLPDALRRAAPLKRRRRQ